MLSVIAALLSIYEAGKAAGLILAGLFLVLAGAGGLDAGTVNSGLIRRHGKPAHDTTGGLACLAVWRSSLNFVMEKPDWKWILPLFSWQAALSWGFNIVIAYLGLAQHSRPFSRWQRNRLPYRLWLGICLYGFAAPFSEELVFGELSWEIQRGIRRACCHGIFRRGFRHLPREPGAGDICFLLGIILLG